MGGCQGAACRTGDGRGGRSHDRLTTEGSADALHLVSVIADAPPKIANADIIGGKRIAAAPRWLGLPGSARGPVAMSAAT